MNALVGERKGTFRQGGKDSEKQNLFLFVIESCSQNLEDRRQ